MAFFRFSRDKRGYEHFYLVEPVTSRKGKSRQRVLYWYRTPPNVRVGRVPFDDEVRRALEAQYPGVTFDWQKIVDAPIPSAEADMWRERRRTERAERAARRAAGDDSATESEASIENRASDAGEDEGESDSDIDVGVADAADAAEPPRQHAEPAAMPDASADSAAAGVAAAGADADSRGDRGGRRRRRRRRGRPESPSHDQPMTADADTEGGPADEGPEVAAPDESIEPSGE